MIHNSAVSKAKRPLGRSTKRWKDQVRSDVENSRPRENWQEFTMNRDRSGKKRVGQ